MQPNDSDVVNSLVADSGVVVMLVCPWKHVIVWPADLTPYPDACVHKVATTAEDGDIRCLKTLTPGRRYTALNDGPDDD